MISMLIIEDTTVTDCRTAVHFYLFIYFFQIIQGKDLSEFEVTMFH